MLNEYSTPPTIGTFERSSTSPASYKLGDRIPQSLILLLIRSSTGASAIAKMLQSSPNLLLNGWPYEFGDMDPLLLHPLFGQSNHGK